MKKLYALGMLGAPLLLAATWVGTRTTEEAPQQEVSAFPRYSLESDHFAMDDMGSLLERIGREIHQDEQFTIGGTTFPLSGFGGVEVNVNRYTRGEETSTGVELHFNSAGRTTTPISRRTGQLRRSYDPYERSGRNWEPSALADVIAELGETLSATGTIVLEHHRVPFRGAASIDQRLIAGSTGRRYPYKLEVHVLFGEGEFEGPDDDEDYTEDQEYGLIKSLARDQREGADRAAVAQTFARLAADLRAGRVRVGDEEKSVGETPVTFKLTHVTATDGSWDKIEFSIMFGARPPTPEGGDARYGDEQFNEPIVDLAAILQRLAAQILEDGTFELGGDVFSPTSTANWDVHASPRGFAVEVKYQEPPEQ